MASLGSLLDRALAALARQKSKAAERDLREALRLQPHHVGALNLLGVALMQQQRWAEAEAAIRQAIALSVPSETSFYNHGLALKQLGGAAEAREAFARAIALNPAVADTWNNLGTVLNDLERFDEAVAAFDRAITLNRNFAPAHFNRAHSLVRLNRIEDARLAYREALRCDPRHAEAWFSLSLLSDQLGEVKAVCEEALGVDPRMKYIAGRLLHVKAHGCDWSGREALYGSVIAAVREGACVSYPFHLLATPASAADQLKCALACAADMFAPPAEPMWRSRRGSHGRIRIAYVSGDYLDHAVMHLAIGLFEHHDRSRFETFAISHGPADSGPFRMRLESAFDRFIDVRTKSNHEISALIRDLDIDIAVDLQAFTSTIRMQVLAPRPAPIQVNYLGYPGTSGAPFIDYIIADPIVIPPDQQQHYSEKIVTLPQCYQPNDRKRAVSEAPLSRADAGLPERGFVFCSFNNAFKISPEIFDVWMRLLRHVDGSVLWLFQTNAVSVANLREEARRRGVAPERLVFAPLLQGAEHLARQRLADLFLDTLHYNGHTTASDALWVGLPVLTCLGSTFAGRVAASLLHAAGVPELVTPSLADYETLALKLAGDPTRLAALRDRLLRTRLDAPLFDSERSTRHLEAAYTQMVERFRCGLPPQSFAVDPIPPPTGRETIDLPAAGGH